MLETEFGTMSDALVCPDCTQGRLTPLNNQRYDSRYDDNKVSPRCMKYLIFYIFKSYTCILLIL